MSSDAPINATELRAQASAMRLHGLLAHWSEVMAEPEAAWRVAQWLGWEVALRSQRSLERRVRAAHLGQFKPIADFDWDWPEQIDR
ncbi:MAG TPA: AAA family ATPase, partial [Albitalea sp.]